MTASLLSAPPGSAAKGRKVLGNTYHLLSCTVNEQISNLLARSQDIDGDDRHADHSHGSSFRKGFCVAHVTNHARTSRNPPSGQDTQRTHALRRTLS
jgi:hypothetical protein